MGTSTSDINSGCSVWLNKLASEFRMSTDKISIWETQWQKGDISFHLPEVNPKLLDNMDELIGCEKSGEKVCRDILVPLCGKSKDLVHLHGLGHNVVGCEGVEQACTEFFSENNIEFTRTPLEGIDGSLFSSADGRLRLFQCDFLALTPEVVGTKIDAVWDIQSLVSINPRDRKQYVRTLRSLLADDFRYLLVTIEYEPFAHLGRPHSISYNAVKELFGSFSNVKFIAQLPAQAPWKSEWKENVFAMVGGVEDRVQYWQARWATGQSQWNSEKPHQYLLKYLDVLTAGSSSCKFFLPLCGKAGDLMYLYNEGHTVTGVEGVPFVVEQFFRENKLDYEKISMPEVKGWKFKTKDGRLCIYACDFFSLTPAMVGEVDAVYDRGALEAINVCDRQGYVKLMHQIVGNEFRYVLNAYEYDDSVFQGPPRNLPRDEVFNLFADFAEVDILEEADKSDDGADKFNLEWMVKVIYTIKPSQQ